MVGSAPTPSSPQPQYRFQAERAPIYRVPRELDVLGAPPEKQVTPLRPIGQLGTRVDLIV
jgi:hypothetical protein